MEYTDLETAFCGIIANKDVRTITYLVNKNYDEVLRLLNPTSKHRFFIEKENKDFPIRVEISLDDNIYILRFPNNADLSFIEDKSLPYHINLSFSYGDEIIKPVILWSIVQGVKM